MDIDFLMFGPFTVHWVDAEEENTWFLGLSRANSTDVSVRWNWNKCTRTSCAKGSIQSFHITGMVPTEHIDYRLGEHSDHSSGFDALGPKHEDECLTTRLWRVR